LRGGRLPPYDRAVLKVAAIAGKGRGVLAGRRFAAGEVIERAPVIVVPARERPLLEKTALFDYRFAWGEREEDAAIALGFGSLYNHSFRPNARFWRFYEEREIEFTALCDIEPGEEITVNYNGAPDDAAAVWFPVA
jgi:SET domain-containing protein